MGKEVISTVTSECDPLGFIYAVFDVVHDLNHWKKKDIVQLSAFFTE